MGSFVSISDIHFGEEIETNKKVNTFHIERIHGTDLYLSNCPSKEDDVLVMRRMGINSCITLQECSEPKLALKYAAWESLHLPTNPYVQIVSHKNLERGYQFVKRKNVCLREIYESPHLSQKIIRRKEKKRPKSRCVIHCMDGGNRSRSLIRYILIREGYNEEDIRNMIPK